MDEAEKEKVREARHAFYEALASHRDQWMANLFYWPSVEVQLDASRDGDPTWHLDHIACGDRGKGKASAALKEICALADQYGQTITLEVGHIARFSYEDRLTVQQLKEWYRRHGFKGAKYMWRDPAKAKKGTKG